MIEEKVLLPILRLVDGVILLGWSTVDGQDKFWPLIFDPQLEINKEVTQYLFFYKVVFVGSTIDHPFKEEYIGTEEQSFCCLRRDYVSETTFIFFFLAGDGIPEHFNSVPAVYFET